MGLPSCLDILRMIVSAVFEYDTSKIVHIRNKKVGCANRLVQLVIFAYIIVYGIVLQKGYQRTAPVQGTVTNKVKGASFYNGDTTFMQNCMIDLNQTWSVYDTSDYVIPPQEPNSFFIMTNMWITCNQHYGVCPESPEVDGAICNGSNQTCLPRQKEFRAGNGATTGQCSDEGTCEIYSWCPVEAENKTYTNVTGPKIYAANFTVLVKNSIQYPGLTSARKRNILATHEDYLHNCTFDPSTPEGLYCPIFTLEQIVGLVQPPQNFTELATLGAVIGLEINWDCDNLERGIQHCNPHYSAERLDDPGVSLSPGYNFRYATYHYMDGVQYRTQYKAYGILFKIRVTGTGGAFDFSTLLLKIGSMIALLSIATVVCDVVVLYVLKKRSFYRSKKYLDVDDTDAFEMVDAPEGGPPSEGNAHHDNCTESSQLLDGHKTAVQKTYE